MSNVSLDCTLHHRASIIVLDVSLPTGFWQVRILSKSLLTEILDRVVICVCQKVVQLFRLSMVLKFVHEAGSIAFNLLLGRDGQENDLRKFLFVKGAEDTPAEYLWLLSLLLFYDDHRFVNAVHH